MNALKILFDVITNFLTGCVTAVEAMCSTLFGRSFAPSGSGPGSMFLSGQRKIIVAAVCCILIIASLIRLLLLASPSRKVDLHPYGAMGRVCGEETSKLLGGHGQVVAVVWDVKTSTMDAEIGGFKHALRKTGDVSLRGSERLKGSTLTPMMEELTTARPTEIIARYPGVNAIVSFVGVPQITKQDLPDWPRTAPKLVAVGGHDPGNRLNDLLSARVVVLAITPRVDAIPKDAKKPATDREWVDQNFRILMPSPAAKTS